MTENSREFLAIFNRIEKWMQGQLERPQNMGFTQMAHVLKKRKDLQIARYEDDLIQIAQLRNAIVHDMISPDFVIAEPNDWVIKKIREIEHELLMPEKLNVRFRKKVMAFEYSTPFSTLLHIIADKGYSQFPIYNKGRFVGLLTTQGIGQWLAKESQKGAVVIDNQQISDIMDMDRKRLSVQFMSGEQFVFQAVKLFQENPRLETILITHNGRPGGDLIGIIRPKDLFVDRTEKK